MPPISPRPHPALAPARLLLGNIANPMASAQAERLGHPSGGPVACRRNHRLVQNRTVRAAPNRVHPPAPAASSRRCSADRARCAATLLAGALALAAPGTLGADWRDKVAPTVLAAAAETPAVEVLLQVAPTPDLTPAAELAGKRAKGRFVYEALRRHAAATAAPLLDQLRRQGIPHRSLWIAGAVWARVPSHQLAALADRPEVRAIVANPRIAARLPRPRRPATDLVTNSSLSCPPTSTTWGVERVGAPAFWALGIAGRGVVVAGQDTGYEYLHPALRDRYRGAGGSHDYAWWDAIHEDLGNTPNPCGVDSPAPCDDNGHGTHTMGTMVGRDVGSDPPSSPVRTYGVAPEATWIGCRNMDSGVGTPASYIECFQFFLAPTRRDGSDADPDLAPDVINNSWGCPPSEGCEGEQTAALEAAAAAVRAAGIVVVASAGNSGSSCGSIVDPPATFDGALVVGATNSEDQIASFSSRGPIGARIGPDLVAPGVNVCSSRPGHTYGVLNGTSMAGPHVSGLVALLVQMRGCLRGEVDHIEALLRETAQPLTGTQSCGGVAGSAIPNNTFGHGLAQGVLPGCYVENGALFCDDFELGDQQAWCPGDAPPALRGTP